MPISGYLDTIFASSGTRTTVPDAIQPSGVVSYAQGYGPFYELPPSNPNYLPVDESSFNQLLYDFSYAIQNWQQNSIPPFITSTMNGGSAYIYPQYAQVLSGGVAYQSLVASNADTPPSAKWAIINPTNGSITEQTITGTNHALAAADSTFFTKRSNSGTAMTDSLPTGGSALANGESGYYQNVDATASITVSGGTINQGNLTGNVIILPGELWFWQSQGSGVYNWQRIAPSVLHSSSLQGAFKNLIGVFTSTTVATFTADELTVEDANSNSRRLKSVTSTVTLSVSGIGGIDTGSVAASTWYFVWELFNPTTGVQGAVASLSSTSPTLPSGFIFKALIGCILTTSGSTLTGFWQYGRQWSYRVGQNLSGLPLMANGSTGNINTPTWTAIALAAFCPISIASRIRGVFSQRTTGANAAMLAPSNSYGSYTSSSNPPPIVIATITISEQFDFAIDSTNIYYASDESQNDVFASGFEINL